MKQQVTMPVTVLLVVLLCLVVGLLFYHGMEVPHGPNNLAQAQASANSRLLPGKRGLQTKSGAISE